MRHFKNLKSGSLAEVKLSDNQDYLLCRFVHPSHMQSKGWWRYEFSEFFTVEKGFKAEDFKSAKLWDIVYWPENADLPYTKYDFWFLSNFKDKEAEELFSACTWQCPETILDEEQDENPTE